MKEDEYYEGKGCKCYAKSQGECACGADWTPKEVYRFYRLRDEIEAKDKRIVELESQIKSINEYVYNIAIGEVTMGYKIDIREIIKLREEVEKTEEKYQNSSREWRSKFDCMHQRAMKAERTMEQNNFEQQAIGLRKV